MTILIDPFLLIIVVALGFFFGNLLLDLWDIAINGGIDDNDKSSFS